MSNRRVGDSPRSSPRRPQATPGSPSRQPRSTHPESHERQGYQPGRRETYAERYEAARGTVRQRREARDARAAADALVELHQPPHRATGAATAAGLRTPGQQHIPTGVLLSLHNLKAALDAQDPSILRREPVMVTLAWKASVEAAQARGASIPAAMVQVARELDQTMRQLTQLPDGRTTRAAASAQRATLAHMGPLSRDEAVTLLHSYYETHGSFAYEPQRNADLSESPQAIVARTVGFDLPAPPANKSMHEVIGKRADELMTLLYNPAAAAPDDAQTLARANLLADHLRVVCRPLTDPSFLRGGLARLRSFVDYEVDDPSGFLTPELDGP